MIVLIMAAIAVCGIVLLDLQWRKANRIVERIIDEEVNNPRHSADDTPTEYITVNR